MGREVKKKKKLASDSLLSEEREKKQKNGKYELDSINAEKGKKKYRDKS